MQLKYVNLRVDSEILFIYLYCFLLIMKNMDTYVWTQTFPSLNTGFGLFNVPSPQSLQVDVYSDRQDDPKLHTDFLIKVQTVTAGLSDT